MKWALFQASLPPRAFWTRSATDWADGASWAEPARGARAKAAISSEPVMTVERRSMGWVSFRDVSKTVDGNTGGDLPGGDEPGLPEGFPALRADPHNRLPPS